MNIFIQMARRRNAMIELAKEYGEALENEAKAEYAKDLGVYTGSDEDGK